MELGERNTHPNRRDATRLVDVHTRLNRLMGEMLDLVAELDTDEALLANAMTNAESWLHFDLGIAPKTARAWVRAAGALPDLPMTSRAFRHGAISLDELLILCRFATPDNESELLDLTRQVAVDDLAAAIRHYLDLNHDTPRQPARSMMRMWWEAESLELRGSIPGADGVLVETALRRLAATAPLEPADGYFRDPSERHAEALVQMASESVAEDRDHDRATVVVHVNLDSLSDPDATVRLGGRELARDDLLRLTCDGRLQPAIDDPRGVTIGIGRVSRQIPAWLRRTMLERDVGCRFPGCRRTRWTHGHHLQHWANGGPTNLDNLVTLCGFHHRLIHRQGWELRGNPNSDLRFINQWGEEHRPARPHFPPDHQQQLVANLHIYAEQRLGLLATANSPP
ncbi:MAG: DUF222 domain-containing protein [Acidimicrobiia bacterium]|nr:DUF222 domain-containing protein [Acidimicrobiia bacterium]